VTKRNLITLALTVLFSLIIAFLIYKKFVYPTVIPLEMNGLTYIFADWGAIVSANVCEQKGLNVYLENPCDVYNRKHVYGEVLLHLPFVEFNKFYQFYFPLILNILFLFIIVSFFTQINSFKSYFLVFFVISLPVILVIERANSDILIFLMMYLISKYKNLFLSHILIIFSTLCKFYPICFSVVLLFQRIIKNIFINISLVVFFLIVFLVHQHENLIQIFNNSAQFSGSGVYQFSLKGLIMAIPNIQLIINDYNINWLIYLFIAILLILPLIFFVKKILQSQENEKFFNIFDFNIFENRLYLVSSLIIVFCYFLVQNFNYREIFLIGLVPYILKNESAHNRLLNNFYYLIVIKFLMSTILVYLIMNKVHVDLNYFMNLFKHILDFYVVSILSIILFLNFKNLFKKHFLLEKL
tara:strand:+ start:220 stop:1455 length:1236 start_codon:yes stop_codon:yes gene_type:complete